MADTSIVSNPFEKRSSSSGSSSSAPDSTMNAAMDRVKQNAASMARSTAGKMMGGNTMISVNSMKGEALRGRNDNVASKKAFKGNRYARSAE